MMFTGKCACWEIDVYSRKKTLQVTGLTVPPVCCSLQLHLRIGHTQSLCPLIDYVSRKSARIPPDPRSTEKWEESEIESRKDKGREAEEQ